MVASVEPVSKQPRAVPAQPRVGADASLSGLGVTAFNAFRDIVVNSLDMVALESRLAGFALAAISGVTVAATVLLLTAWGLLIAAGVVALMQAGVTLSIALLSVAGANVIVAAILIAFVPRLARRLSFQSTRNIFRKDAT